MCWRSLIFEVFLDSIQREEFLKELQSENLLHHQQQWPFLLKFDMPVRMEENPNEFVLNTVALLFQKLINICLVNEKNQENQKRIT